MSNELVKSASTDGQIMTIKAHLEQLAACGAKKRPPYSYRKGTIATNGFAFLWAPMSWPDYHEPSVEFRAALDGIFNPNSTTLAAAQPVGPLREWAGPLVWKEPCPECKGIAKGSKYVYCSFCDDDGEVLPDYRRGYLYGLPLDRNYLAMLLPEYWTENVTLRYGGDAAKPVYLTGETWLAGIMLMYERFDESEGADPWATAPRFPTEGC